MTAKKPVFDENVRDKLRDLVLAAPPSLICPRLKSLSLEVFTRDSSLLDHYYYLHYISTMRANRVSPDLKKACDVRRNYDVPKYAR